MGTLIQYTKYMYDLCKSGQLFVNIYVVRCVGIGDVLYKVTRPPSGKGCVLTIIVYKW